MQKVAALFVAVACISISVLGTMQDKKMESGQVTVGVYASAIAAFASCGVSIVATAVLTIAANAVCDR